MTRLGWTLSALFVVAALAVVPASAAVVLNPTAVTVGQMYSLRADIINVYFEGALGLLPGGYTENGVIYSPAEIEKGTAGNYAAPTNGSVVDANNHYLTVGSNTGYTPITITFAGAATYFGLYLGSPDSYNKITFNYMNGNVAECEGGCLSNGVTGGSQTWAAYVEFDFATPVSSIELSSTQAALESDNHAFHVVPEPASLVTLGLGLLLIGAARRRQRIG